MATKNIYRPEVFDDLPVCELWDGWESIANYMIVRGEIPVGRRVTRRLRNTRRAREAIAELEQVAYMWPAFRKRKPVEQCQRLDDVARSLYPHNNELGYSTQLVALADAICGSGTWRTGQRSAMHEDVLVKVLRDKPLAMIAPARRNDWVLA